MSPPVSHSLIESTQTVLPLPLQDEVESGTGASVVDAVGHGGSVNVGKGVQAGKQLYAFVSYSADYIMLGACMVPRTLRMSE